MHLHIISTGGTIDKIYFDAKNDYQVGEPAIGELLQRINPDFSFTIEPVLRKDSLDITDADRASIRQAVQASGAERVLITHGTDSMVATANTLQGIEGKCIVLTGAMLPAAFSASDALFNIGCAIGALQCCSPGVYIAMNGHVLAADNAIKNPQRNCFEALR
jgi:L-asparaginase